jgi:hypothetical protein
VQAAVAKAAQMVHFDSPSSSSSSLVSAMDLSKESEELSEIVELPSLGTSYEWEDLNKEFVFVDSVDGWGMYLPPWLQSVEDCGQLAKPESSEGFPICSPTINRGVSMSKIPIFPTDVAELPITSFRLQESPLMAAGRMRATLHTHTQIEPLPLFHHFRR